MKNKFLFKIIYCSIMAALSFVCTFFELPLIVTITFYGIPLIFVGVMYGPIYGCLTGLVAGVLEQLKYGISLQTFLWILAPLCWGGISGFINVFLKKEHNYMRLYKIVIYSIFIVLSALFANLFNSLALAILGYTSEAITNISLFFAFAIPRLVSIPIHVIIYIPVCYIVCEKFKKITMISETV